MVVGVGDLKKIAVYFYGGIVPTKDARWNISL